MTPPIALEVNGGGNEAVFSGPVTVGDVYARRAKGSPLKAGVAASASADQFKGKVC